MTVDDGNTSVPNQVGNGASFPSANNSSFEVVRVEDDSRSLPSAPDPFLYIAISSNKGSPANDNFGSPEKGAPEG